MKIKSSVTMAALSGVLLTATLVPPVMAETKDLTKMSCDEFLALDDVVKPKLVYWAEGFNKKGMPVDATVDVDETDQLIPVLITECKKTPEVSFWEKIKSHF